VHIIIYWDEKGHGEGIHHNIDGKNDGGTPMFKNFKWG
jgi:hypothetical protein